MCGITMSMQGTTTNANNINTTRPKREREEDDQALDPKRQKTKHDENAQHASLKRGPLEDPPEYIG